jgi:hypothetical protein
MANIKELIQSIESGDSSFDEKLAAINKMEETLVAMREQEKEAVDDNVELIVEAIKLMEKKVADQLEIAKSIVPEKGDKGDKGQDGLQGRGGLNGKDGRDGKNGLDGKDGEDGVSVTDAKIDFDGSLIITLSTGREINVGEVVAPDLAERLSVISTMSTNTAVANITSGTIDGTVIGGTTPAAGTFTTLTGNSTSQFGRSSANYLQATGGATTKAVEFKALGSDTNISQVFQSKGTGAIDLAAGSSGVNISNGGTVTALTVTAAGSAYTSIPTPAITAPTTAGGVQAVATATMLRLTQTIVNGGTGYTVNDNITVVGGTFTTACTFIVASVSGGVVTGLTVNNAGTYSVLPTGTLSTTGGTGTGLTLTIDTWGVRGLTIGTAGSGYVEQPTVTFSGGGGSGAAAFAVVGSTQIVRGLSDISFYSPGGEALRILDRGIGSLVNYAQISGSTSTNAVRFSGQGSDTNIPVFVSSKGTSQVSFYTNNIAQEQLRVTHTASAVNYVQVTGGASGSPATVTISAQGSSTDVDFAVTPRGAGVVRFGTYTGTILTPTGYITIKDSGGTTRRLLVG